jgi:alanyl-tRNA synthetase
MKNKGITSVDQLRKLFVEYFESQGHTVVESAPLLAKNDPTLLFVNSGMVPFKDVFAGRETRPYSRAISCQKCLRVSGKHNDFEQIGQTRRHHTFFEMLGNFSLGDYFKEDAIKFAWTFLTEKVGLPRTHLWVSVHKSDDEAKVLWQKVAGVESERIIDLGDDTNLWAMGDVGPWGYCSEIFMYIGDNPQAQSREEFLKDDGTYLEVWNLVFMQYFRDSSGQDTLLPKPCIDTGMGLERLASVVVGAKSNYDTPDFQVIISKIEQLAKVSYRGDRYEVPAAEADQAYRQDVAMRVIADHTRAASFLIADGVAPGNEGASYVLRRLIRRAIRYGQELRLDSLFMHEVAETVIAQMGTAYPELKSARSMISELLRAEEERFRLTLKNGLELLRAEIERYRTEKIFPGQIAFQLYDTFGFPLDLTQDVLKEEGMSLEKAGFDAAMEQQRERSRSAAQHGPELMLGTGGASEPTQFVGYAELESTGTLLQVSPLKDGKMALIFDRTPFYAEMGGQIGDSGQIELGDVRFAVETTQKLEDGRFAHCGVVLQGDLEQSSVGSEARLTVDLARRHKIATHHSATHLLNAALRTVLGDHVIQRGSFVSDSRLRFDFSHFRSVSHPEMREITQFMNEQIRSNYAVTTIEMPIEEAKHRGALATFGEKYGETVRVVQIGPRSVELCGGTHVQRSGDIGIQLVVSEGSVSSGIRRIEVVAGSSALDEIELRKEIMEKLGTNLKTGVEELPDKVASLLAEVKKLQKDLRQREEKLAASVVRSLVVDAQLLPNSVKVVVATVDADSREFLLDVAAGVINMLGAESIAVVGSSTMQSYVVKIGKTLLAQYHAGEIVEHLVASAGGKGGGRPDSAFWGGIPQENMPSVRDSVLGYLGRKV